MDALEQEIESLRTERERCMKRLSEIETVLSAMERAASLRPLLSRKGVSFARATQPVVVDAGSGGSPAVRKGGGRRAGDISKEWREILSEIYKQGLPQTYENIADIAEILGSNAQLSSVRDRVRHLLKSGFLSGDVENGFIATQDAVERFGFTKGNVSSTDDTEANAEKATGFFGAHNPQSSPSGAQD